VGAVFNRDYPGNRGQPATSSVESRPLPQTINFYLNGFECAVVS